MFERIYGLGDKGGVEGLVRVPAPFEGLLRAPGFRVEDLGVRAIVYFVTCLARSPANHEP